MYLVLTPTHSPLGNVIKNKAYQSFFTDSLDVVSDVVGEPGAIVYKLDALTQLKDVEVTYQEITEETNV